MGHTNKKSHLLSIENLSFQLPEKKILDGVSFAVHQGQFVTIIGPNGAGKTTLLKMLVGLLKPTHGRVLKTQDLQIGYVPQKLLVNYLMPLTVESFLKLSHMPDNCQSIMETFRIEPILNHMMHTLSGGEFQRVLLARALMHQPQLLILDEPTQGLDSQAQEEFFQLLLSLKQQQGFSVLMVSHDLHLVHGASDHVICLNQHICCAGIPSKVVDSPEYKSLFPALFINDMALYKHNHDHVHDNLDHGDCDHDH